MAFFRERNNIQREYSGYQDISSALRERLAAIVGRRAVLFVSDHNYRTYVQLGDLNHKTTVRLNKKCTEALLAANYDEAFEAYEIFLAEAKRLSAFSDIIYESQVSFQSAGSVYTVDASGQIILKIPEETARNIQEAESTLETHSSDGLDFFRRAVRDLLSREREANDIIKDFAVAMEKYIEALTGKSSFKEALKHLEEQGVLAPTQREVLNKLYAYRGDADGVAHSGNTKEPGDADAIWFLETFVAQIRLIEARLPNNA